MRGAGDAEPFFEVPIPGPFSPKTVGKMTVPVVSVPGAEAAVSRDIPAGQHTPVDPGQTSNTKELPHTPSEKGPQRSILDAYYLDIIEQKPALTPEHVKEPSPEVEKMTDPVAGIEGTETTAVSRDIPAGQHTPVEKEALREFRSSVNSGGEGGVRGETNGIGSAIDADSLASRIRSSKQRMSALSGGIDNSLQGNPSGVKTSPFRVDEQFGLKNELHFPPRETAAPVATSTKELLHTHQAAPNSVQKLKHTSNRIVELVDANKFLHVPDVNTQKVMFTNAIWNRLHKGHEFDTILATRSTSLSGISTEHVRVIVGLDMHAWEYDTTWADQDYLLWQLAKDFQEALEVDAQCVNIHSQGWKGPFMVTVQLTRTSAAAHSGFTEDAMAEVLRGIADKNGPLSRGRVSQYLTSVLVQRVPVGGSNLLHAVDDPSAPVRRRVEDQEKEIKVRGVGGRRVDLRVMVARASAPRASTLGQELVVEAVVGGQRRRTSARHGTEVEYNEVEEFRKSKKDGSLLQRGAEKKTEVDYNEVLEFQGVAAEEALQLSLHVKQAALLLPLGSIVIPTRRFRSLHHVLETSALNKASAIDKLRDEAAGASISFVLETMDGEDVVLPLSTDSAAATTLDQRRPEDGMQRRELPRAPSVGSSASSSKSGAGSRGLLRTDLDHSHSGFDIHDPLGGSRPREGGEQVEPRAGALNAEAVDGTVGTSGLERQPSHGRQPNGESQWIEKTVVTRRVAGQQGTKVGLGFALSKTEPGNYFRIASIHSKSYLVGNPDVSVGDILVAVNGVDIKGYNEETTMHLIRGEPGSRIELVLADDGMRMPTEKTGTHYFLPDFNRGQWSVVVQFSPNGLGLDFSKTALLCDDEEYLEVTAVDPQGPAGGSNKIKPGDLLLAIEGRPLHKYDEQQVQRMLTGPVGQRVHLTIGENRKAALHRAGWYHGDAHDITEMQSWSDARRFTTSICDSESHAPDHDHDWTRTTQAQAQVPRTPHETAPELRVPATLAGAGLDSDISTSDPLLLDVMRRGSRLKPLPAPPSSGGLPSSGDGRQPLNSDGGQPQHDF